MTMNGGTLFGKIDDKGPHGSLPALECYGWWGMLVWGTARGRFLSKVNMTWASHATVDWIVYLYLQFLPRLSPMLTNVWSTHPVETKAINEIKTVKATEKQKE